MKVELQIYSYKAAFACRSAAKIFDVYVALTSLGFPVHFTELNSRSNPNIGTPSTATKNHWKSQ